MPSTIANPKKNTVMTSILRKFKSLAIVVMVFSFFMGVTLSSCSSSESGSENAKEHSTESTDSEEHPAEEGEEHPTDEEHPSDSTKEEHPTKEDK